MNNSDAATFAALAAAGSDDARVLWSIVALLVVVGVAMAMLAVAVVRATRPDRELLAPLEVMGRRKWRRSDPVWQRRQLDAVRPPDAQPLTTAPAIPEPLEGFEEGPLAGGFDDLADVDSGVDHDLTELPGGVVFDADPTPPSGEVPVVAAAPAAAEVPLSQLGIDWSAPHPADLAAAEPPAPRIDPQAHDVTLVAEPRPDEAVADEALGDDALGDDALTDEQIVDDEPIEDASGAEAWSRDAPADDAPAEGAPTGDAPVEDALAPADAPADDAPGGESSADDAAVHDVPVEESPVADAPADDARGDESPRDGAPVDGARADDVSVDEHTQLTLGGFDDEPVEEHTESPEAFDDEPVESRLAADGDREPNDRAE